MKDTLRDKIAEIVDYCSESYYPEHEYGNTWADRNKEYLAEAVDQILSLIEEEKNTNLDALYWMYVQYCSGGHDFMNAGEDASELLENAGYITVDGAGRILKDNGDTQERATLNSKGER